MDIARSEMAEAGIDAFIGKRHRERVQSEGARAAEELWQESVRAYNARQGDEQRLERLHYHENQARRLSNTLGSLVAYHQDQAAKYRENGHHKEETAC